MVTELMHLLHRSCGSSNPAVQITMMGPTLFPLLALVAGCYCAPANLLDVGGTVGYNSKLNGTIGGHVKLNQDGMSVNGNADGIVGAEWQPEAVAKGFVGIGDKYVGGDASVAADINNSWQPGVQGEFGRTSKGTWVAGLQPYSVLNNKLLVSPRVQVKTGDDAKAHFGIPINAPQPNGPVYYVYPNSPPAPYAYINSQGQVVQA